MHGTVCFRSRRLNDAVGWLAISLYAWFDVSRGHTLARAWGRGQVAARGEARSKQKQWEVCRV
jgi:hypothetical protein